MNESEIFAQALRIADPAQRSAFLQESCNGDLRLLDDLNELIASNDPHFLEQPPSLFDVSAGPTGPGMDPASSGGVDELSFLAPSDRPDSLGRLGHHEILDVTGRGGMGIVLRGFDEKLQRVVAIKVMATLLAADVTSRKRFLREARAAAAVSHDNVVTIHAVEEVGDRPYLVMNFVAGQSLEQRLKSTGPLQLHEVLRIGMQTAAGLAAAHAQGIVHRDIKPANILLENGVERVKITDFGVARAIGDPGLTHHGTLTGTPSYMAPEQAHGEALDHRADIFSLGSVLYAMCTGRAPFRGRDTIAVLKQVCDEAPLPIQELNPDAPHWLCAIIEKLHEKRPEHRYQTAKEVAELLEHHLGRIQEQRPRSASSRPGMPNGGAEISGSLPRASRTAWLALAASGLLALLGIAGWQLFGRGSSGVGPLAGESVPSRPSSSPAPLSGTPEPVEKPRTANSEADALLAQARAPGNARGETAIGAPVNFELEFNGLSNYVQLPEQLNYGGSHPFTMECWATPIGPDHHLQRFVLSNGSYDGKRELGLSLYERGNKYPSPEFTSWAFAYSDQSGLRGSLTASPQSWATGKTAHIAVTVDGPRWRFYTNGSLWRRGEMRDRTSTSKKPFCIGRHPTLDGYYSGRIDEIRFSKVVRYSDDFVPARRFVPDEETLALYHCDQVEGDRLPDASSHGHHGEIKGASLVRVADQPDR